MLKLYNTETRTLEEVRLHGPKIKMYTCGPTIYDFAHIGNFRTYVMEDLLRRALHFFQLPVEQVMNITDLDDKTIGGAIRKKISLKEYTDPFKIAFFEDLEQLGIEKVEHYPEATRYVPEMIQMIESLLEKGIAYRAENGSVYFSIGKFEKYGRLSHFKLSDLKVNASGENDADEYGKENISDFALWKSFEPCRDGNIFWESPFGKGRPGWHIECSAMATKILGDTIDIHCGGVDNLFPHHENEIAQSEGCSGHLFVRHWFHVEHLLVDHKKMSKSLGNFYTLRDLLKKGYTGKEVRYLLLSTHYRVQLNFSFAALDAAKASLERISDLILRLKNVQGECEPTSVLAVLERADEKFRQEIGDDLNISNALAVLFDLVRELNTACDGGKMGMAEAHRALDLLKKWDAVLGVLPLGETESEVPQDLQMCLIRREEARRKKNWKLSDEMRDQIQARGYLIEDTPQGARLKKR